MGNHRGEPFLLALGGLVSPPFQLVLDFYKAAAIQIHVEDQPDGLGLFRIDVKFHQLSLVRQQFLISVIPQNVAVAIIDTVIHGCLLTAFDTDGGFAAFILGESGHDGEPELTIAVEGLDAVIDEVDLYPMLFQQLGVLQGVHGISGEPGYLTGQNQVKLVFFRILNSGRFSADVPVMPSSTYRSTKVHSGWKSNKGLYQSSWFSNADTQDSQESGTG